MSVVLLKAQAENGVEPEGRHITREQIKVLEKALVNEPKGTIFVESLGFLPPPPPSSSPPPQLPSPGSPSLKPLIADWNRQQKSPDTATSEFAEVKTLTEQLWNVLQKCGYDPLIPGPSHVLPPPGVAIRFSRQGRFLAETLRKSLIASHIKNIQLKEDEANNSRSLMIITIGSE